jgi:hypothetical protein
MSDKNNLEDIMTEELNFLSVLLNGIKKINFNLRGYTYAFLNKDTCLYTLIVSKPKQPKYLYMFPQFFDIYSNDASRQIYQYEYQKKTLGLWFSNDSSLFDNYHNIINEYDHLHSKHSNYYDSSDYHHILTLDQFKTEIEPKILDFMNNQCKDISYDSITLDGFKNLGTIDYDEKLTIVTSKEDMDHLKESFSIKMLTNYIRFTLLGMNFLFQYECRDNINNFFKKLIAYDKKYKSKYNLYLRKSSITKDNLGFLVLNHNNKKLIISDARTAANTNIELKEDNQCTNIIIKCSNFLNNKNTIKIISYDIIYADANYIVKYCSIKNGILLIKGHKYGYRITEYGFKRLKDSIKEKLGDNPEVAAWELLAELNWK